MTKLSLSVQYGIDVPDLPRWRIRRWVERAVRFASARLEHPPEQLMLTVRLVDDQEARMLNQAYRGRDYATNVLTFNYDDDMGGHAPQAQDVWQADIVICDAVLRREANEQLKPMLAHAAHLCIHATLHALGFDHEVESEALEMEALETMILADMGIEDPYQHRAG